MSKEIPFTKMHGAGNDFIVINNIPALFTGGENEVIRRLCQRRWGIGADGLMLLGSGMGNEFELQYFNADGFSSTMCGNGARCAAYFLHLLHPGQKDFILKIGKNRYPAEIVDKNLVKIVWDFTPRLQASAELDKMIRGKFRRGVFVNTGVPHVVFWVVSSLDHVDVDRLGAFYRNHKFFAPDGTNVNFVEAGTGGIRVRTYERGVEAETLACGTGALAVALAARTWGLTEFPVQVHTRGGNLSVGKSKDDERLWLEGPAQPVFSGIIRIDDF